MRLVRIATILLVLLALLSLLSPEAAAHTRSQSYSNWTLDGEHIKFVFRVNARRVTQLATGTAGQTTGAQTIAELLYSHLSDNLRVRQDNQDCTLKQLHVAGSAYSGKFSATGTFNCPKPIDVETIAGISAFSEVSPSHIHIAHINGRDYALTAGALEFPLLVGAKTARSIVDFVHLGIGHVLSGADHIAFLIALMLAALTLKRMLWSITGFTIGHSLTLALVTLGTVTPKLYLIEAMIGYSIALVAVEIVQTRRALASGHWLLAALTLFVGVLDGRAEVFWFTVLLAIFGLSLNVVARPVAARWLVLLAIVFGIIHGAGFASGLIALEIPSDNLLGPLFGFNIGVEIAQLLVIVTILGCGVALGRYLPADSAVASWSVWLVGAALFGIGLYWFGARLLQDGGFG